MVAAGLRLNCDPPASRLGWLGLHSLGRLMPGAQEVRGGGNWINGAPIPGTLLVFLKVQSTGQLGRMCGHYTGEETRTQGSQGTAMKEPECRSQAPQLQLVPWHPLRSHSALGSEPADSESAAEVLL